MTMVCQNRNAVQFISSTFTLFVRRRGVFSFSDNPDMFLTSFCSCIEILVDVSVWVKCVCVYVSLWEPVRALSLFALSPYRIVKHDCELTCAELCCTLNRQPGSSQTLFDQWRKNTVRSKAFTCHCKIPSKFRFFFDMLWYNKGNYDWFEQTQSNLSS